MKGAVSRYTANQIKQSVVLFSCWVVSDSLRPHGLKHTRLPCPLPSPRACTNSCPLSWWCNLTILSSVIPFSSCLQSFPASGSFPMSQLFASGDRSIGASASASVLPVSIQRCFFFRIDWFDLTIQGTLKSLLQHCMFIYIHKKEKLWRDKSETDKGAWVASGGGKPLSIHFATVCIRKTSQSFSCVLPLLTHNAAPLTLNVFPPPPPPPSTSVTPADVPQLDSILTLPTWRRHQIPQAKDSDPQDCTPHPTHRCQWQGVDPPKWPTTLVQLGCKSEVPSPWDQGIC